MAVLVVAVIALLLFPERLTELSILALLAAAAYPIFSWLSSSNDKLATIDLLKKEENL